MYYKGQGVRRDLKKAKELFGKACDMKVQSGCDNYRRLVSGNY
jgi:TPR repeat protein